MTLAADEPTHMVAKGFPRARRARVFLFLGILIAIALLRWEIITSPPYYDFAFSFWPEANYLAENNFDWGALHTAPFLLSEHSGPRAYFTTVLPTIAAVGIWLSPDTVLPLLLYHTFTFACAALVFVLLMAILAPRLGNGHAFLVSLAAFLTPVYCAQVDMLGMEIPLAAFAMLTAYCIDRQRLLAAVGAAFLAFTMKSTGAIVMVALIGLLGLFFALSLLHPGKRNRRQLVYLGSTLAFACAALGSEWLILQWGDTFSGQLMQGPPLTMMLIWCPDLVVLFLLAALSAGTLSVRWLYHEIRNPAAASLERIVIAGYTGLVQHAASIFSIACIAGILLAVKTGPHLPRYFAFIVPLLYIVLAPALYSTLRRGVATAVVVSVLAINLVNWNGFLFPDIATGLERFSGIPAAALARSGSFYERSHEYLADHRSTIEAMRIVDQHRADGAWIMGMPFPYFLAYPSFGYVKTPLVGYSVNGITGVIPKFKETSDLYSDMPLNPIFIKAATYFYAKQGSFQIPDPSPEDEILYRDSLPYPLVVFRKRWREHPPQKTEVVEFYERQKWPEEQFAASVYYNLQNLGIDAAIGHARNVRDSGAASAEQREWITYLLAALLTKSGKEEEARSLLPTTPDRGTEPLPHESFATRSANPTSRFESDLMARRQNDFDLGILCLRHLRLKDAANYFRQYLVTVNSETEKLPKDAGVPAVNAPKRFDG